MYFSGIPNCNGLRRAEPNIKLDFLTTIVGLFVVLRRNCHNSHSTVLSLNTHRGSMWTDPVLPLHTLRDFRVHKDKIHILCSLFNPPNMCRLPSAIGKRLKVFTLAVGVSIRPQEQNLTGWKTSSDPSWYSGRMFP